MSGKENSVLDYVMLRSKRNKPKILYNGFFYVKDYTNNNKQFWRCCIRKCKGRLVTSPLENISKLEEIASHNHIVSEEDIKKVKFSNEIIDLAESTQYSTNKVYSIATTTKNINLLPIITKKSVYNHIQKIRKRKSICVSTNEDLSKSQLMTSRGENFCLYDSGSESMSRFIIFTCEKNVQHLKNCSVWIADGTFKVVPTSFYQLYIIHGKIFNKIFPLIYVLMPNKNEVDYDYVLNILREKLHLEIPENVIVDFEVAAFNAFKKASKETNLYFCLFHLGQCIWRQIQKKGLTTLYNKDINFRLFAKCFSSLAFVPIANVEKEFSKLKIKSKIFKNDNIDNFVDYFEKNFIKSSKYPLSSWNAHFRVQRGIELTTNAAELFHLHFSSRFDQHHSSLDTFVSKLLETQSLIEQDINYILCHPSFKTNSNYESKMIKIKDICDHYNQYYGTHFLECISKIYNWKYD